MKPKVLLSATSSTQGVLLLEADSSARVEKLGSTIPTSVDGKEAGRTTSLALSVNKGESGLVAVMVTNSNPRGGLNYYGSFLEVRWDKTQDKPHINLDSQWIPTDPKRMAQIIDEHIEVLVNGQIFSSELRFKGNPEHRYVSGDMICRYAIGEIGPEELEAAATELVQKEDVWAEVLRLRQEVSDKIGVISSLQNESRAIAKQRNRLIDELGTTQKRVKDLRDLAEKLDRGGWFWWCSKRGVAARIFQALLGEK